MNNLLYRLGVRLVADDQEQDSQGASASASGQHHATNSSSQVDVGLYRMNFRLMLGYAEAIRNAVDDDVVLLDMRATCMLLADDFAIDPQLSAELDRISTIINQLYTSATANQSSLTAAQISLLCRIMISNQHAISSANGKYDIGRGFYPVTALLNHSCQPNISWQTSAKTRSIMECRALQDIAPGTPLTISYVNPLRLQQQNDNDGCKQRKQFLLGERGFLCACQLCAGRCNQCAKGACTLSCARCRLAWYCSTECQREDWPRHNRWCKQQSTAYHEFQ
jgi:hypothetical protein